MPQLPVADPLGDISVSRQTLYTSLIYISAGLVSVLLALGLALPLVHKARSQNPPPAPAAPVPTQVPAGAAPARSATSEEDDDEGDEDDEPETKAQKSTDGFLQAFEYELKNRRDPFSAPVEAPAKGVGLGPLLPLQRFELDQLKLTAIIWDVARPKAMVRDPSGKVHIISRNDKLGRNNGYVAVIREGELVVIEPIEADGKKVLTSRLMKLAK